VICYKLTDAEGRTNGAGKAPKPMQWAVGVTNRAAGEGTTLCTSGVLHVYRTPEQAAFMAPAHVPGYSRLYEVEVPEIPVDDGTKCGVKEATVLREIPLPELTTEQRVEIAIRVSLWMHDDPEYRRWAEEWLDGRDRSAEAALAALAARAAQAAEAALAALAALAARAARAAAPISLCEIITGVVGGAR